MRYLIILFLFLSFSSFAQKGYKPVSDLTELSKLLNENASKTNTIKSDFVQVKHMAFLQDSIVTNGKFWFKKENTLRWEYTNPFNYIIVINNGKFIIKDDSKKSEFDIKSNKAFQEVNKMIVSSVRGTLMEENLFNISAFKSLSSYLVRLSPKDKNMKSVIQEMDLYFNLKDYTIYKLVMRENEEDYTVISFKNRKINEPIPANTFILK